MQFTGGVGGNTVLDKGPSGDHTPSQQAGGRFTYVDVKTLNVGDVISFLTYTSFPASVGVCKLRFWYFMSGE